MASRSNLLRFMVLLLPLVGLPGCVVLPIPHKNTLRPEVTGTLTLDGKPWADARVVFSSSWPSCAPVGEPVTTDAKGRFHLPIKQKRKYVVVAPLAPLHRVWTAILCVEYEGAFRPVFLFQQYGLNYNFFQEGIGYLPRNIKLECRLDSGTLGEEFDLSRCRSDPDWPNLHPDQPMPTG